MQGDKVRLRRYTLSDLDETMRWVNDEEITQFLDNRPFALPLSREMQTKWLEYAAAGSDELNQEFAIETVNDNTYIGSIALHGINWIDRNAELTIAIGKKEFWAKGCGTESVTLLLRIAFERLDLQRVWLKVYDFNTRAIAVYEKCGFVREGQLRRDAFKLGRFVDRVVMGILREEWRRGLQSPS
jgi:RimJ/RimL family protein N-acetyltransferase